MNNAALVFQIACWENFAGNAHEERSWNNNTRRTCVIVNAEIQMHLNAKQVLKKTHRLLTIYYRKSYGTCAPVYVAGPPMLINGIYPRVV